MKNFLQKFLSSVLVVKTKSLFNRTGQIFQKTFSAFAPREKFLVGLFVLVLIGSILAVGVQVYVSRSQLIPDEGGEIEEALIGLPRSINPVLSAPNDVDRDLVRLVYAGLVTYDAEGNISPDLAEEYTVSEDGTTYTFTLKENLIWEDGEPITAEDVLFTINLIKNPDYGSPIYQVWESVEVSAEDRTIQFELPTAYPAFIENATLGILPEHIWEGISPQRFSLTDFNLQPIGSGMFKVDKFTKNSSGLVSSYTLAKNENYHGKKPYIDKITFKFYPSEEEAIRAYNSKAVDSLGFISPANIGKIEDPESLQFYEFDMPRIFAIFFNQDANDILEDPELREALSAATNTDVMINEILLGYAKEVDTPMSPSLEKYYNRSVRQPPYNIGRAQQLLEEAGWDRINDNGIRERVVQEEGEEEEVTELKLTVTTGRGTELEKIAQAIKDQWREAGILVEIQSLDLGELQQESIRNRTYEVLLFGQTYGATPDPYPFWHSSQTHGTGLNLSGYANEDVDALIEDARIETDEEERIQSYMEFQETVSNDLPAIFLYGSSYVYPINKVVKGVEPAFIIDGSFRFVGIENWYTETRRTF